MYILLSFNEIDSTNTYAKKNALVLEDKTVILSQTQTQGRGRKDHVWVSDDGGLYFSLLLKPQRTQHIAIMTLAMCLSICKTLETYGLKPSIKWPNDVHINGKKISGILAEAVAEPDMDIALVLGVGLNISQEHLEDVGQPATSLKLEGVVEDKNVFLKKLLDAFLELYPKVIDGGFPLIKEDFMSRFPFVGKTVTIGNDKGVIKGISDNGTLILTQKNNIDKEIIIGDWNDN